MKTKTALAEFKSTVALILLCVVLGFNFFLAFTLMQTVPKIKLLAQILVSESLESRQNVRAEPFESNIIDKKMLEEMFVRSYISLRFTYFPDEAQMRYTWGTYGPLWFLSSPRIYRQFWNNTIGPYKKLPEYIKANPLTQSVDIKSMFKRDNIWIIEVQVYQLQGGTITEKTYTLNLTVTYVDERKVFNNRMVNPYGFVVVRYTQTEKRE